MKKRGKRTPLKNNTPETDKIRGTLVQLLWSAAAPGLKPLRLPRAQMGVHVHLKNAFPGWFGNRRITFGYNLWFASHHSFRHPLSLVIRLGLTLSTAMNFASKFFRKRSFFDQDQQPLNNVEPFERILLSLHNARTNSFLFSILEMVLAGSDWLHVISDGFDSFPGICMLCESGSPQKLAKFSKIIWKIWKFWTRISVDQVQCSCENGLDR